jgi:2-methylisocitrate lyase-like PEP mutase family enzyme
MNQYEKFYQLHHQQKPLMIANAWNARSAQLIEDAGFEAIGTSSGAISSSLGYEDGEKIPFNELLYIVQRIKASIKVPLTVDMERGYTDDLNILTDNIQKLIDTGVSGINIEDAQGEDIYVRKLESIKNYLLKTNQQLFINARMDAFSQKLPAALETNLRRARLYKDAGADGLFVIAVPDEAAIKEIVSTTTLPVNMVATPKFPIETLENIGIRRISMAVLLYKTTYNQLERISREVKTENSFVPLF